jgi:hypothetical protein
MTELKNRPDRWDEFERVINPVYSDENKIVCEYDRFYKKRYLIINSDEDIKELENAAHGGGGFVKFYIAPPDYMFITGENHERNT